MLGAKRGVGQREADRRGASPILEMIFPRFGGRGDYAASAALCAFNSNSMGLT
jgi:hypothetical protein